MKKRIVIAVLISLLSLLVSSASLIYAFRPDYRFLLNERIASVFRHADVEVLSPDCTGYTFDELQAAEHVTFNIALMLISEEFLISDAFSPELTEYNGAVMTEDTLEAYKFLSEYLNETYGTSLFVRSSYRTVEEQKEIYDSYPTGAAAVVGGSEHQSGMALDVYLEGYAGNALIKTKAGQHIHSGSWQQGFILRYPWGKTKVTGIVFEPWHIRYVGELHAQLMYEESLTLDEYICDFLQPNVFYSYQNAYISRQALTEEGTLLIPDGAASVTISPDNTGYYIITAYFEA